MQAWCIDDGQLQLTDLPDLEPGPEQVCVQVKAVGVNRADLLQVRGLYPAPAGTDNRIPGLEYAGVVSAVGDKVLGRRVGDRVMGLVPGCAYAEQVVSHERETLSIPDGMDFAAAATLPEAFLTAYRALFLEGGLQPGQWCLIRPASAGVGLAATQLARALGARPIGSSRAPSKLTNARQMGLLEQVTEGDQLAEQLLALTNGHGVAVILDMVGPDWQQLLAGLRSEGVLVNIGLLGGTRTELNLGQLLMKRQTLKTLTMRSQPIEQRIRMAQIFNDRLAPLLTSGALTSLPRQEFPFAEAIAAHTHMASNDFSGKRVLLL